MRVPLVVVGVGLTLAACGGSGDSGSTSATLPAPETTSASGLQETTASSRPSTTSVATTTSVASATTEPGTAPPDDTLEPPPLLLSVDAALLPDEAFPPPWEPQWRTADRDGYGAGPNQTDCASYWLIEELRGGGGAHALWWIDGGNANHYVTRLDHSDDVGYLLELASIADECPTVHWNEGGSFAIEALDLDDAIGLKLSEGDSGEATWLAVTSFGGLVSVLDIPLWTGVDGHMVDFGRDELNRLATQARERLRGVDLVSAPTTIAPPTIVLPTTSLPPVTRPTTTMPAPATGLGKLLLDQDELPAGFFSESPPRPHRRDEPDADLVASCPAAVSIERIDALLQWSATAAGDDIEVDQIIGRAESTAEAIEVVALFAEMTSCELSNTFGQDADTSGGLISVDGADAAASLVVVADDRSFVGEVIAVAVDDVVMIVSAGTTFESERVGEPPFDRDITDAIATLAVAKVRAAVG